jgi:hypothetical protein
VDELADKARQNLQSLKREYVIKLFADHADTRSLFEELGGSLTPLLD